MCGVVDGLRGERRRWAAVKIDRPVVLYDFVKQVALVSFKNGVTVGKRKGGHLDARTPDAAYTVLRRVKSS